jgi:DNA-directed RNA polymerase specialized sigma24 family protein
MRTPTPPVAGDGHMLRTALQGGDAAWKRFHDHFRSLLVVAAKPYARDLPPELIDDVVQEALLAILRSTARGPRIGLNETVFVLSHVRNAAAKVRAAHRAPGTRSRTPRSVRPEVRVGMVDPAMRSGRADHDLRVVEARLDVERLARRADPVVRTAIEVALQGASLREAARQVGMTHTLLMRRLRVLAVPSSAGSRPRGHRAPTG